MTQLKANGPTMRKITNAMEGLSRDVQGDLIKLLSWMHGRVPNAQYQQALDALETNNLLGDAIRQFRLGDYHAAMRLLGLDYDDKQQ